MKKALKVILGSVSIIAYFVSLIVGAVYGLILGDYAKGAYYLLLAIILAINFVENGN